MRILFEQRLLLSLFATIGVLTMLVMLDVELPLLLGQNLEWERKIDAYRTLLHIHAVFGSIALMSAPLQFFSGFRQRHLALHRQLGHGYVLSILISAPIGIYIALEHLNGGEKWAATMQAILWIGTTVAAVHAAVNRHIGQHQVWIARSYALTLTFVVSRLIVDVLGVRVSPALGGNASLIAASTLVMLMVADVLTSAPAALREPKRRGRDKFAGHPHI